MDPIKYAEKLRPRMINLPEKKVLLARFTDPTSQMKWDTKKISFDFFRRKTYVQPDEWDRNPLPYDGKPASIAAQKLNLNIRDCTHVLLFQVNGCNLSCWFCYVNDEINRAIPGSGRFFTAQEILLHYLAATRKAQFTPDKLNILRISGGEPMLVPEIIVWLIEEVKNLDLQNSIYLWADTNLTPDFYFTKLNDEQRKLIKEFPNIGFMGCYKGIDEFEFWKNTKADPKFLSRQFKMHRHYVDEGLDFYTYLVPLFFNHKNLEERIKRFIKIFCQEVGEKELKNLWILEMHDYYTSTKERLTPEGKQAIEDQEKVKEVWQRLVG